METREVRLKADNVTVTFERTAEDKIHVTTTLLPTLTGRSSLKASAPFGTVSLKTNWLLGLNGMKRDVLDGRTSSTSRARASDRTIKISASIATTIFGSSRTAICYGVPVPPKNCDRQHNICAVGLLRFQPRPKPGLSFWPRVMPRTHRAQWIG
jgi:hypothetical protein